MSLPLVFCGANVLQVSKPLRAEPGACDRGIWPHRHGPQTCSVLACRVLCLAVSAPGTIAGSLTTRSLCDPPGPASTQTLTHCACWGLLRTHPLWSSITVEPCLVVSPQQK